MRGTPRAATAGVTQELDPNDILEVQDMAAAIARAEIDALLGERTRIDVAEYERLMNLPRDEPPAATGAPGTFRFTGVHDDRRTYAAFP